MNSELQIIKGLLPQMTGVLNATVGEPFSMKDAETLLILQRKLPKSDLETNLLAFNELFSAKDGVSVSLIEHAAVAFVKIKVLADLEEMDFSPEGLRALYKEWQTQITKLKNIMHLSEVGAMTADEYQKERIKLTTEKNEALLSVFQIEVSNLEKKLERLPKVQSEPEEAPTKKALFKRESLNNEVPAPVSKNRLIDAFDRVSNWILDFKERHLVEEKLKDEEKRESKTRCEEIPYYKKSLNYTEVIPCKDIPEYSLLKQKNNVYFGLSKNVGHSSYNNEDESLVELTEASEEFLQFMSEDLLSGEYVLKPFTKTEKQGLLMYFDFISGCFRKSIGITLSVREYLNFKTYYNRLIKKMLELEAEEKEDYYKALILCDSYFSYMESYDLKCADSEEMVIKNIISETAEAYLEDLQMILDNHIVCEEAKADMEELMRKIREFHKHDDLPAVKVEPKENIIAEKTSPEVVPIAGYPLQALPFLNQGMMQIVVQILNQEHEVVDEALYAGQNMKQAICDYNLRNGYIKRMGFRNNGQDLICMEEMEEEQ